jgi:FkbM family methyltransferase
MTFVSYAQNHEDVMLWRALKHVERGFYVDVGANDPVQDSVTKAFYDRGWSGINIEPVTAWHKKLVSARPRDVNLQVAVGSFKGDLKFFEVVDTGLSTMNRDYAKQYAEAQSFEVREITIPVQKLANILEENFASTIHFLKIDVEGSEKSVLESLDFQKFRPWILLIEATQPLTQIPDHKTWEHLVVSQNYNFVYFDGINRFYIADERSELRDAFHSPPNFWDGYETFSQHVIRTECEELKNNVAHLKNNVAHLKEEIKSLKVEIETIMNSRSMRITAPLRQFSRLAKTVKCHVESLFKK